MERKIIERLQFLNGKTKEISFKIYSRGMYIDSEYFELMEIMHEYLKEIFVLEQVLKNITYNS